MQSLCLVKSFEVKRSNSGVLESHQRISRQFLCPTELDYCPIPPLVLYTIHLRQREEHDCQKPAFRSLRNRQPGMPHHKTAAFEIPPVRLRPLKLKFTKSFSGFLTPFILPTVFDEVHSNPPSCDEVYSYFAVFFVYYTRELLILLAQNAAPKKKRQADSTDFISSALTRRFGLAGGLAWLGILSFGVISEQVKTRREVFEAEQNTKYVSLLLAFRATAL